MSRSQAAYDLAELVEAGILERLGGGRATHYRLARKRQAATRHWTSERIRAELAEFCAGQKAWPSASAFKAAGRGDLYVAASRYGGIGLWAVELGFPRPGRAAPPSAPELPLARKFAWAGAGALAAALVVAAAAAVVVLNLPRESTRGVSPARTSPSAAAGGRTVEGSNHQPQKTRTPAASAKKQAVRRADRRTTPRAHTAPNRPASSSSSRTLIGYSAPARHSSNSSTTPATTSHVSTPTPTASGGPSPLRAPLAATGPTPLKAP